MYKPNKLPIIITSFILINLTSCTNLNKNSTSEDNSINQIYLNGRTIDKNHKVSVLNNYDQKSLGRYEYNDGVYTLPPVGYINENVNLDLNTVEDQSHQLYDENNEEVLFTLEEVQQITENLHNQYNEILVSNSNDYENYINNLSHDYLNLENEYLTLLNYISSAVESPEEVIVNNESNSGNPEVSKDENIDENNKDEEIDDIVSSPNYTNEERLDILYRRALTNASNNLDEFKPIQGQVPDENKTEQSENKETTNLNNENQIKEEDTKINSSVIFDMINQNLSLPNFEEKNLEFLESNYKLSKYGISDFKIVKSKDNNFEMLILDASNISEEDLVNSIEFRIDSILSSVSENTNDSFNLDEKVLVLNIDNYILFCFSDINNNILNFLQSI